MPAETGAPETETGIAPEMIEAGLDAYYARDSRVESDRDIVVRIFSAMYALKKRDR